MGADFGCDQLKRLDLIQSPCEIVGAGRKAARACASLRLGRRN